LCHLLVHKSNTLKTTTTKILHLKNINMKAFFTLTSIVLIVIASLVSFSLFKHGHYTASALLVLTSFLSATLWIYVLASKKVVLS
jgi:hypothetical protein